MVRTELLNRYGSSSTSIKLSPGGPSRFGMRREAVSPASFVFVYSDEGVRVTPAISVVASNGDPSQLYDRSAQRFFEEHLECFIGDRRMDWPTPETLTALREQRIARSALLIRATAE